MLKLCNSYIVVIHLLLLFNIAHSFVLLTANVEDVKKIARKFVSDELAEKIADFIARATETFSHQVPKASEENFQDNSQVSAENRMYNIARHGNFDGSSKLKLKNKGKNIEKNDPAEANDEDSKPKLKKETKGKSRYIIESDQLTTTTKKASPNDNGDDNYDNLKESIKMIENNLLDATNKEKTKKSKKKAKVKPYKLLSTYDSDEVNTVKDGATGSKEKKEKRGNKEKKKDKQSKRAYDDEITAIRNAALAYEDDANQNTAKTLLEKDDSDKYGDDITKKSEKAANTNSLVKEKDTREGKWWEKDMPRQNQDADANLKHKTWF